MRVSPHEQVSQSIFAMPSVLAAFCSHFVSFLHLSLSLSLSRLIPCKPADVLVLQGITAHSPHLYKERILIVADRKKSETLLRQTHEKAKTAPSAESVAGSRLRKDIKRVSLITAH